MPSDPNIVWLVMESVRFDHTSLSTYDRDTTPNLTRISAQENGRSFSQCFSHSNWTRASMASMLTGTHLSRHRTGIRYNDRIPDELPTVPEYLQERGYRTVCLPNNAQVGPSSGLDRGFEDFTEFGHSLPFFKSPPTALVKYALNIRKHGGGFTLDGAKHPTDFLLTEMLKRKLAKRPESSDPVFSFVHLGNPHRPYTPPLSYIDAYTDDLSMTPSEARDFAIQVSDNLMQFVAEGCPLDEEEWKALEAMYDACISYTDHLIGDIFEFVVSNLDDTVFVVTADHGELLGEKGLLAHKLVVDDAVTNVPLVVHGPTDLTNYGGEMIQHIDVIRTLFTEMGIDAETLQGNNIPKETRQHCIIQRGGSRAEANLEKITERNPDFDTTRFHRGPLTAIRTDSYRYEKSDSARRLYRLPDETNDRIEMDTEVSDWLAEELSEFLQTNGQPVTEESQSEPMSEDVKQQLAELGYLVDQ